MCDRSRHKFRLSQCRTKRALKGLVVRIPRDKVEVFPDPILKQTPLEVQCATVHTVTLVNTTISLGIHSIACFVYSSSV